MLTPGSAVDCASYGAFVGVIGGSPAPMGSPARARAPGQRGRHELAVRAVHAVFGTDQTPDEHSWKLKKKQPKK